MTNLMTFQISHIENQIKIKSQQILHLDHVGSWKLANAIL